MDINNYRIFNNYQYSYIYDCERTTKCNDIASCNSKFNCSNFSVYWSIVKAMKKTIIFMLCMLLFISVAIAVPIGLETAISKVKSEKAKIVLQNNLVQIVEKLNITENNKINILEIQDDNFKVTIAKKAKLFWIIPINIKDKLAFDNNTTTLTYNKSWLWIFSKEI